MEFTTAAAQIPLLLQAREGKKDGPCQASLYFQNPFEGDGWVLGQSVHRGILWDSLSLVGTERLWSKAPVPVIGDGGSPCPWCCRGPS